MLPEIFFEGELLTPQASGPKFESLNPIKKLGGSRSSLVILVCSDGKDRTPKAS